MADGYRYRQTKIHKTTNHSTRSRKHGIVKCAGKYDQEVYLGVLRRINLCTYVYLAVEQTRQFMKINQNKITNTKFTTHYSRLDEHAKNFRQQRLL